jgi:hypothetical protein
MVTNAPEILSDLTAHPAAVRSAPGRGVLRAQLSASYAGTTRGGSRGEAFGAWPIGQFGPRG